MKRLVLTFALPALLLAAVPGAVAAPPARHLGQTATGGTAVGPCMCTALQFGDLGLEKASYLLPFDGVITKSGFYVGEEVNTGDSVQVRAFRRGATNHATVTGDGTTHLLPGLPTQSVSSFYERMPVSAGDVLGGRFKINSGSIDATPVQFNTSAPADEVGATLGSPALGETFETGGIGTKLRVNVEAVLEPDDDHDGYGDVSQDLCPGSPIGGGPCSGSLFGSDFQKNHGGVSGSGFDALYVQRSIGGTSTAAPSDGVVVRWRLLGAPTGDFGIKVISPTTGSSFQILRSSPTEHVTTESSPTIGKITSFATRLPIPAGGYLGLATPSLSTPESALPSPGSSLAKLHDGPDGTVYSEAGTITTQEFGYDADIEPDADHDGYGDVTQDSCPGTPSVHDGQCPVIDVFPPAETPKITGLEVAPKKFRVKAKGTSAKLKLKLSEAATVAFGIEAKKTCASKGKGKKARCKPGFHSVQTITQKLPAGQDTVPYSARLRGQVLLQPGSYRVTAVPTAGGVTGKAAQTTFKVLPPRHRAGH